MLSGVCVPGNWKWNTEAWFGCLRHAHIVLRLSERGCVVIDVKDVDPHIYHCFQLKGANYAYTDVHGARHLGRGGGGSRQNTMTSLTCNYYVLLLHYFCYFLFVFRILIIFEFDG